jgi:AcrR family transcriptional regulator
MSSEPATLGLRERKKLKTRETIQTEAMRLFVEQGYAETSIEQIAEAADVSPSTFFRYFPSKEQVVLYDDIDPMMLAAMKRQPAGLHPLEVLRNVIEETLARLTPADRERERVRQGFVYSVPELRATLYGELNRNIDMIAEGMAERFGRSPDDFEVRVFAGAVTGAIHAVIHPEDDYVQAVHAIEFLQKGMPLS